MQYRQFNKIDGRHPWRKAVPDAYIDYAARTRHGGRVFYFNFELAKEMGLIGKRHPDRLNAALSKAILDTFSLAIIAFEDGTSINVRAYRNLLRPAHLFRLLKQGQLQKLRSAVDYYIARQRANGRWPRAAKGEDKYRLFLKQVTRDFARAVAVFDSEYIFCWLDWDGDNVLMDGAVLDYGSVRQFGLYHHEYRYDDVQRMSTTITEQKNKARYIVQSFVQIVDYIVTGRKKGIRHFAGHPALRSFDEIFDSSKDALMIHKLGYNEDQRKIILSHAPLRRVVQRLRKILYLFERVQSRKGAYRIDEGITADALFCVRDILRELPEHYLSEDEDMDAERFIDIMKSEYATSRETLLTATRRAKIKEYQRLYRRLAAAVAMHEGRAARAVLMGMAERSALINRYERVTGDAVLYVGERLVNGAEHLDSRTIHEIFRQFVEQQVLRPEFFNIHSSNAALKKGTRARRLLSAMLKDVRDLRSGL